MGKTFRNMRDESRTRGKNKMVNREEKAIEKYKKHIYNKASTVNEDADYDDNDEHLNYESNSYIQPIQRK